MLVSGGQPFGKDQTQVPHPLSALNLVSLRWNHTHHRDLAPGHLNGPDARKLLSYTHIQGHFFGLVNARTALIALGANATASEAGAGSDRDVGRFICERYFFIDLIDWTANGARLLCGKYDDSSGGSFAWNAHRELEAPSASVVTLDPITGKLRAPEARWWLPAAQQQGTLQAPGTSTILNSLHSTRFIHMGGCKRPDARFFIVCTGLINQGIVEIDLEQLYERGGPPGFLKWQESRATIELVYSTSDTGIRYENKWSYVGYLLTAHSTHQDAQPQVFLSPAVFWGKCSW